MLVCERKNFWSLFWRKTVVQHFLAILKKGKFSHDNKTTISIFKSHSTKNEVSEKKDEAGVGQFARRQLLSMTFQHVFSGELIVNLTLNYELEKWLMLILSHASSNRAQIAVQCKICLLQAGSSVSLMSYISYKSNLVDTGLLKSRNFTQNFCSTEVKHTNKEYT